MKKETLEKKLLKKEQAGVDTEAAWIKKGGKSRYGYKKHVVTDSKGLILGVTTTPANVNEIANLEEVLAGIKITKGVISMVIKAINRLKMMHYYSQNALKIESLQKAKKNKPLTEIEKKFNKLCGKIRYKIERTFGSIKRWFNGTRARYKGTVKIYPKFDRSHGIQFI